MKAIFSNNYSLALAHRRWEAGTYPVQHLYGAQSLRAGGWDVRYLEPTPSRGPGRRLLQRVSLGLDRGQLARLLPGSGPADLDIAAEPFHVLALGLARTAGVRRRPLVAVIHHLPPDKPHFRAMLRGIDVAVCLSQQVQQRLVAEHGRAPDRTLWAPWGPDLAFGGYASTGEQFVLSAGKTDRDLPTLAAALRGTGIPARVYGLPSSPDPATVAVPTDVYADLGTGGTPQFAFERVLTDLQRCAVVAIPLLRADRVLGLTELADALALGKPVVMTANPYVDLDLEAVGCGITVRPGDVAGWRAALRLLWDDPARRRAMGLAGRAYAEKHWNADLFGAAMLRAAHLATGSS